MSLGLVTEIEELVNKKMYTRKRGRMWGIRSSVLDILGLRYLRTF